MHLKAIIFDWAGTAVDFGSLCPVAAFQAAFRAKRIGVEAKDIHRFMGIRKWEHVRAVLRLPEVAAKWESNYKREPTGEDVNELYAIAEKRLLETITDFATPTPHLKQAVSTVRERGMKIGSTTGYTTVLMERLAPAARRRGFAPDCWVASDQVPTGRPAPWMIFKNMEHLEVYPPFAVVKLGDTVADVEEADNAGAWSIAVAESSSLTGKSRSEMEALSARQRDLLVRQTSRRLAEAGAHYVIPNLSGLEQALEQIESRLEKGQLPPRLARSRRAGNSARGGSAQITTSLALRTQSVLSHGLRC